MKYKVREAMEAVVGAVTGPVAAPRSLPLGRYDDHGRLQYIGRTTTLAQAAGSTVGALLAPARPSMDGLVVLRQVGHQGDDERHQPELVVGVVVDVARDASGRWRHPARLHRARPDLQPADIPRLTSPPHCGADTLLRCRGRFHRCDTDAGPLPQRRWSFSTSNTALADVGHVIDASALNGPDSANDRRWGSNFAIEGFPVDGELAQARVSLRRTPRGVIEGCGWGAEGEVDTGGGARGWGVEVPSVGDGGEGGLDVPEVVADALAAASGEGDVAVAGA
ncbi:hypothetical protein OG239_01215 [Streptomyces sp. NBC_00868]|uniref:hypothetical protein n=1 Tax=Streptomyces sp. NBC_00868 TaxID=2903683 RepID=UPI00386E4A7C|nr:hypothetical protein OG239_01215 [Streptomyces sp. NBC_00868]